MSNENENDDFMAGFNSAAAQSAKGAQDPAPETPPEPQSTAEVGAEPVGGQGVDTQQQGEQVPIQPEELNLDGLPDNVRQHIEQLQASRASAEDVSAQLTKAARERDSAVARTRDLQARLTATERAQAQPQPQAPQQPEPVAVQPVTSAASYFESDRFKAFEAAWPEEAAIMRESQMATLDAIRMQNEQLAEQLGAHGLYVRTEVAPHLQKLRDAQQQAEREAEVARLNQAHPDWEQINASDEFWDWFNASRPLLNFTDDNHVRERLNDSSYVSGLLTAYKQSPAFTGGRATNQASEATGSVNPRLALAGGDARGNSAPVRRVGSAGISPGDDFMAGFNFNSR